MKKNLTKILLLFIMTTLMFFIGCDELSKLNLNVPLDIIISTSGPNTTITESEYFCLSQYKDWRDNQEDIESANFLEASYWTLSSTPNLQGDVTITLAVDSGPPFYSQTFPNVTPADYVGDNPIQLEFTEAQIQQMDDFLLLILESDDNDACFTAGLTVSNITGSTNVSGNYALEGQVTIVLNAEVETSGD